MAPLKGHAATLQKNKELLAEFYAKNDPAKVPKVDDILDGWPLLELLEALKKKYGECPELVVGGPAAPKEDAGVISSDGSDLEVLPGSVFKKPKRMKKKKKDKKDKGAQDGEEGEKKEKKNKKEKKEMDGNSEQATNPVLANKSGLQVLSVHKAKAKPPKAWGAGTKWWAQAASEVNDIKRKLTQKAMRFVDEAVRISREEKARQAAERREARQLGLGNEGITVLIEDDVPKPEPVRRARIEEAAPESDARDGDTDRYQDYGDSGFRPASGEEESDDENRLKKRKIESVSIRKPSHKEQMSKALEQHFSTLNNEEAGEPDAEGAEPEAEKFKAFEGFDAGKAHAAAHGIHEDDDVSSDSGSSSSEDEDGKAIRRPTDFWGEPPEDLLERTDLEDSLDGSRAYVAHFIRYVMGVWHMYFKNGRKIEGNGLTEGVAASFNSAMVVEKTRESLTPLLNQLQRNSVPEDILRQIDKVASLAAGRDYKQCMQEYVVVTMGRKTWHQTVMQTMMQQNHGGSVARITKQSPFVNFDFDPTMNAYMLALKRVIQFLQWLRPPTNPSMGSY